MITLTNILLSSYVLGRSVVSAAADSTSSVFNHLLEQGIFKMQSNKIKLIIGI